MPRFRTGSRTSCIEVKKVPSILSKP